MCQIISRLQVVRFFMGDYTFLTHLYSSIYLIGIAKKSWGSTNSFSANPILQQAEYHSFTNLTPPIWAVFGYFE